ncbi:MAG: hypothetical protein ACTSQB_05275 [Candidatus Heimdallarchaeota archaeon]
MTDIHSELKKACEDYEIEQVDRGMERVLDRAQGLIDDKTVDYNDVQKCLATGMWIESLWGNYSETEVDCYHKRKAEGEPYNLDFSNLGVAPFNYYELRDEVETALRKRRTNKDNLRRLKTDLLAAENVLSLEECLERDIEQADFIGGVEVAVEELNRVYETIDGVDILYKDKCCYALSIDHTKVILKCARKLHANGWTNADWSMVKKFNEDFGVPLLDSQIHDLVTGEDYVGTVVDI